MVCSAFIRYFCLSKNFKNLMFNPKKTKQHGKETIIKAGGYTNKTRCNCHQTPSSYCYP